MESFNWNLILGIVAVLAVVGISYFFRDRPRCPECKSYKVGMVKKEPQNVITHVQPLHEGVQTITVVYYQVQFQCNECQASWMATLAESK